MEHETTRVLIATGVDNDVIEQDNVTRDNRLAADLLHEAILDEKAIGVRDMWAIANRCLDDGNSLAALKLTHGLIHIARDLVTHRHRPNEGDIARPILISVRNKVTEKNSIPRNSLNRTNKERLKRIIVSHRVFLALLAHRLKTRAGRADIMVCTFIMRYILCVAWELSGALHENLSQL